jgi:hypothetical protein
VQQQTYLSKTSLSGINKVAVVVSVSAPEVSYRKGGYAWFENDSPLWWLASTIESTIRYGSDHDHTDKINKHVDISLIEDKTAQALIQPLTQKKSFQTIEYLRDKNQDSKQLLDTGYDAIIRLIVREISIQRTAGDYVSLHVIVQGQMECFTSGKIIWDREIVVTNPEPRTLDYYKENGLKELDAMLEKAGKNLAYDFIYLK